LTIVALSGRTEEQHLSELQQLSRQKSGLKTSCRSKRGKAGGTGEPSDFLLTASPKGIKLRSCPTYIREWLDAGSGEGSEP